MIIAGNAICLLSVLGFTSVALIPIHTIIIAYNISQYTDVAIHADQTIAYMLILVWNKGMIP